MAYQLDLPESLSAVHNVFHVSQLKKCLRVPEEQLPVEGLEVQEDLTYVEKPTQILEFADRVTLRNTIRMCKVRWGHQVHRQKVPGLLRGSPHPGGLGRRSSPHDEWAGRACQRHDSARTQAEGLQRPQQVWQAMDEGTPLGGLESENDAKPSHGLHAILSSLWGRGRPPHGPRIRFPEDEGVRRLKQPDQPRGHSQTPVPQYRKGTCERL